MRDETLTGKSRMTKTALTKIGYQVYGIPGTDATIEKQYGEWRLIEEQGGGTMAWNTLREARQWIGNHFNQGGA